MTGRSFRLRPHFTEKQRLTGKIANEVRPCDGKPPCCPHQWRLWHVRFRPRHPSNRSRRPAPCYPRCHCHRTYSGKGDSLRIDDWERAQTVANALSPDVLRRVLDRYAQQCCPMLDVFAQSYHWSFMQVEYATDLAFRSPAILKPLYQQLSRQAILTVKAEHVATFLGHRITAQLAQEIGSQFATRTEGTCVRHRFGKSSIKM